MRRVRADKSLRRALVALGIIIAACELPTAPGSSIDDGFFTMTVTAANTSGTPVVVDLAPSGDAGAPGSFSYKIVGDRGSMWYDMRADAPEVTRFGAGETKRFLFDFRVGGAATRYDVTPGTYTFNGAYGAVWASNPPIVVVSP